MKSQVVLTMKVGPFDDQRYNFAAPARCVVGRAEDCAVRVPSNPWLLNISRHHCLLEIDPPVARVCDLGSRNGTFVNGQKIGQRERMQPPAAAPEPKSDPVPLHSGDEIQIGEAVLQVAIVAEEDEARTDPEVAPAQVN